MTGMTISGEGSQQRRNTRADQFCVLWDEDGTARPLIAIEYKAPHKLTIEEICTGLDSDIEVEPDVIDQDGSDFAFLCKRLMAAVVTQLFSYMIDKGVRHGYVCTGEAFIFVRIPEDPTVAYCSVNIPKKDYVLDEENCLRRTAVSQVFAFIEQALAEDPPGQAWIDRAKASLKRRKVEFVDILATIPETERKSREASEYRPRKWPRSAKRGAITLRSRCVAPSTYTTQREEDADSDGAEGEASPTYPARTRSRAAARKSASNKGAARRKEGEDTSRSARTAMRIQDRPYCSHRCLIGLRSGGGIDPVCPNAAEHGAQHMSKSAFLRQVRQQLSTDRGSDANCCPLFIHGSRGAMLKLCLTSRGYTLVAKAVVDKHRTYLAHEALVYDRLRALQGQHVPVCCGISDLDLPYHYDGEELKHVLLLSWGGMSLTRHMARTEHHIIEKSLCVQQAEEAYRAIHALQVVHCDAELRNMLFDEKVQKLMIVDFERSKFMPRLALREVSANRKRKRPTGRKTEVDHYGREVSNALYSIRRL